MPQVSEVASSDDGCTIRVIVVDDDPLVRSALRLILGGSEATRAVVETGSPTRILLLTAFDTGSHVLGALAGGATGFLLKDASPEDIIEAVRSASRGEPRFSAPELDRLVPVAVSTSRTRRTIPAGVTDRE